MQMGMEELSGLGVMEEVLVGARAYRKDTHEALICERFNCQVRVTSRRVM